MQAADQVLQEQLEGLRQTQHRLPGDHEGGDLLSAVVDQLALVGGRVGARDGRRTVVGAWRPVVMGDGHQVERRVVHHSSERVEESEARRVQAHGEARHAYHAAGSADGRWTQLLMLHVVAGAAAGTRTQRTVRVRRRSHRRLGGGTDVAAPITRGIHHRPRAHASALMG